MSGDRGLPTVRKEFSLYKAYGVGRLEVLPAPYQMDEESWFRKEFLTLRRLIFNLIFYGLHLFFFGYGWYSQVRGCLSQLPPSKLK